MADYCEQFCPNYQQCRNRIEGLEAAGQALLGERESLEQAKRLVLASTLGHAFSVIDGKVVSTRHWTESERLHDDLELLAAAPGWSADVDYALRQNSAALKQAYDSEQSVVAAGAACPGPALTFGGRLILAKDVLINGLAVSETDRRAHLRRHAKCSSRAAAIALRKVPKP